MTTVGEYLKQVRTNQKLSLESLGQETKIKTSFLDAIEKGQWTRLPEYAIVTGFVKTVTHVLGADEGKAMALLRRDYPPQKVSLNPKPDLPTKFAWWNPKFTFLAGVAIVLVGILGYLLFQYKTFISPPPLIVFEPKEGAVITKAELTVKGETDPVASVKVNNQPFLVSEEGTFEGSVEVSENTTEVVVQALSRAGKETTVRRNIKVELK